MEVGSTVYSTFPSFSTKLLVSNGQSTLGMAQAVRCVLGCEHCFSEGHALQGL
jgi:hypothetical protein